MHQPIDRSGAQATSAPGSGRIGTEVAHRRTLTDMLFALSFDWHPLGAIGGAASIDDVWAIGE